MFKANTGCYRITVFHGCNICSNGYVTIIIFYNYNIVICRFLPVC